MAMPSSSPGPSRSPAPEDGVAILRDRARWDAFATSAIRGSYLQSWSWGEVQEALGRSIWRLGAFREGRLAAAGLFVRIPSPLGDHLYCPRGPMGDWSDGPAMDALLSAAVEIARAEGCAFLRLDPLLTATAAHRDLLAVRGFTPATSAVLPESVRLLSLDSSEDELLSGMRGSTRYNVRSERRAGVTVERSDRPEDAQRFVELLEATARRKRFINHPRAYYLTQFRILCRDSMETLFIARLGEAVRAMAMIVYYGRSAFYVFGASNAGEAGSLGCLLQWEAICEAKRRGCRHYNFLGSLPEGVLDPGHPWYGFSHFKRGFGGFEETYLRTQDLPLSPRYWLYRSVEKGRRWMKRASRSLRLPASKRAHRRP